MENDQSINFLPMPIELVRDVVLTSAQKILLCCLFITRSAAIIKYQNQEHISAYLQPYLLSKQMGITPRGVYKILDSLKEKDIIKIVQKDELEDTENKNKTSATINIIKSENNSYKNNQICLCSLSSLNIVFIVFYCTFLRNSYEVTMTRKGTIAGLKNHELCSQTPKDQNTDHKNQNSKHRIKNNSKNKISTQKGFFSQKNKIVSPKKKHELLETVMNLPNITKHRTETAAYELASKTLLKLSSGSFFFQNSAPVVLVKEGWLKLNNISPIDLRRAWTERDIIYGFSEISKMLSPGYWPVDKLKVPHDVSRLVYNPYSKISHFLKLFNNGAISLDKSAISKQEIKSVRQDKMDLYAYEKLCDAVRECCSDGINEYEIKSEEARYLHKSAVEIMHHWDRGINAVGADYTQSTDFVEDYCGWITEQHSGRLEKVWMLGPNTRDWSNFFKSRGLYEIIKTMKAENPNSYKSVA